MIYANHNQIYFSDVNIIFLFKLNLDCHYIFWLALQGEVIGKKSINLTITDIWFVDCPKRNPIAHAFGQGFCCSLDLCSFFFFLPCSKHLFIEAYKRELPYSKSQPCPSKNLFNYWFAHDSDSHDLLFEHFHDCSTTNYWQVVGLSWLFIKVQDTNVQTRDTSMAVVRSPGNMSGFYKRYTMPWPI